MVLSASIFSAGPLLHLWVAERFCNICGISNKEVLREIIVGTEFPDIRYLTHDLRSLTHPVVSDIKEIYQSKTPFEAGMNLHAWLDVIREKFISKEIYNEVASYAKGFSATLLKFIEEEILSDFYDGRSWSFCFDNVLPEELKFAKAETILQWHKIIQWSMAVRISNLLWFQSFRGGAFEVSANNLYNWAYLLPKLSQKPIFQDHMHLLLSYIEKELQTFPAPILFSNYKK